MSKSHIALKDSKTSRMATRFASDAPSLTLRPDECSPPDSVSFTCAGRTHFMAQPSVREAIRSVVLTTASAKRSTKLELLQDLYAKFEQAPLWSSSSAEVPPKGVATQLDGSTFQQISAVNAISRRQCIPVSCSIGSKTMPAPVCLSPLDSISSGAGPANHEAGIGRLGMVLASSRDDTQSHSSSAASLGQARCYEIKIVEGKERDQLLSNNDSLAHIPPSWGGGGDELEFDRSSSVQMCANFDVHSGSTDRPDTGSIGPDVETIHTCIRSTARFPIVAGDTYPMPPTVQSICSVTTAPVLPDHRIRCEDPLQTTPLPTKAGVADEERTCSPESFAAVDASTRCNVASHELAVTSPSSLQSRGFHSRPVSAGPKRVSFTNPVIDSPPTALDHSCLALQEATAVDPATAGKNIFSEFCIRIDRGPEGERLGINTNKSDGLTLRVDSVAADGLVSLWNTKNPSKALYPGDRIVAVNGRCGNALELLDESKSGRSLDISAIRLVSRCEEQPGHNLIATSRRERSFDEEDEEEERSSCSATSSEVANRAGRTLDSSSSALVLSSVQQVFQRADVSRPLGAWTVDDVCDWVTSVALLPAEIASIFRSHAVNGTVLGTLSEDDLFSIGVTKFGWRRRLSLLIDGLKAFCCSGKEANGSDCAVAMRDGGSNPESLASRVWDVSRTSGLLKESNQHAVALNDMVQVSPTCVCDDSTCPVNTPSHVANSSTGVRCVPPSSAIAQQQSAIHPLTATALAQVVASRQRIRILQPAPGSRCTSPRPVFQVASHKPKLRARSASQPPPRTVPAHPSQRHSSPPIAGWASVPFPTTLARGCLEPCQKSCHARRLDRPRASLPPPAVWQATSLTSPSPHQKPQTMDAACRAPAHGQSLLPRSNAADCVIIAAAALANAASRSRPQPRVMDATFRGQSPLPHSSRATHAFSAVANAASSSLLRAQVLDASCHGRRAPSPMLPCSTAAAVAIAAAALANAASAVSWTNAGSKMDRDGVGSNEAHSW